MIGAYEIFYEQLNILILTKYFKGSALTSEGAERTGLEDAAEVMSPDPGNTLSGGRGGRRAGILLEFPGCWDEGGVLRTDVIGSLSAWPVNCMASQEIHAPPGRLLKKPPSPLISDY